MPPEQTKQAKTSAAAKKRLTYLGRPQLIGRDDDGDPLEEDVYNAIDGWDGDSPVSLRIGETAEVSAELAALLAEQPDAFQID